MKWSSLNSPLERVGVGEDIFLAGKEKPSIKRAVFLGREGNIEGWKYILRVKAEEASPKVKSPLYRYGL